MIFIDPAPLHIVFKEASRCIDMERSPGMVLKESVRISMYTVDPLYGRNKCTNQNNKYICT